MNIERHTIEPQTLAAFAEANSLTLEVHERTPRVIQEMHASRFYAHFANSHIKDGGCLARVFGDGDTEQEAITNYARRISEQVLVIDAMRDTCREIQVPVLVSGMR